jgi:DNA-binding transcriptional LysR family regulator
VAGDQLYARLSPMMQEMEAAVAEVVDTKGLARGPLRINAPRLAAAQLIAPRLKRFHESYPDVQLDVIVDDALVNIVSGHFDAGIRIGERLDKDVVALRLTPDIEFFAVASPEYLARHGEPVVPADLHAHRCINWRFPGSGEIYRWELEKDGQALELSVDGPVISNDQELVLQAALQGLGIVFTYDDRMPGWIREGRLKRVLADWSPKFPGFFIYYPNRRHLRPSLRAFIECLREDASSS